MKISIEISTDTFHNPEIEQKYWRVMTEEPAVRGKEWPRHKERKIFESSDEAINHLIGFVKNSEHI
jgi:hypothetical protein